MQKLEQGVRWGEAVESRELLWLQLLWQQSREDLSKKVALERSPKWREAGRPSKLWGNLGLGYKSWYDSDALLAENLARAESYCCSTREYV